MLKANPLIIALDVASSRIALNYVRRLKVTGVAFKVGYELFCAGGRRLVDKILSHDVRLFLDLKFHDIPQTVAKAAGEVTRMGVWMFNLHASGGLEMMKRAKESSLEAASKLKKTPPLVLGVTVLTSLEATPNEVLQLAVLAQNAHLDGVVASGQEARLIREKCGSAFKIVTPGIRLGTLSQEGDPTEDQKRICTPQEAIKAGSDYLVIGRPILKSSRPLQAIEGVLSQIMGS